MVLVTRMNNVEDGRLASQKGILSNIVTQITKPNLYIFSIFQVQIMQIHVITYTKTIHLVQFIN